MMVLRSPDDDSVPRVVVKTCGTLSAIGAEAWNELWSRTESPTVFARYEWAQAWWDAFSQSRELQVFSAYLEDELVALVATSWPTGDATHRRSDIVLVGDEHADYAALLVDSTQYFAIGPLIEALCKRVPWRARLILQDVRSDTGIFQYLLHRSNSMLSRWQHIAGAQCPRTLFSTSPAPEILRRKSARRSRSKLARLGAVRTSHLTVAEDIAPYLDAFFDQHVRRWAETGSPSLFLREPNRNFYRGLVENLSGTGDLVFSVVEVEGLQVAFHFGFVSEQQLLWYKPSFEPALAGHSPGQTLISALFSHASVLGLLGIDFTRGDEPFKYRFANDSRQVSSFVYYGYTGAAVWARTRSAALDAARGVSRFIGDR